MSKKSLKGQYKLEKKMTIFISSTIFATNGIVALLIFLLSRFDFDASYLVILLLLSSSFAIAVFIIFLYSKWRLKDFDRFAHAMEQVANGNFDIRVDVTTPLEMKNLAESFNKMAKELSSIELLKNDFISKFSHEFKTPIASIKGFIHFLEKGNISDENRRKYFEIIDSETDRLAELSNNILLLSKLETLELVTDKEKIRLDEHLRQTLLLMETPIQKKQLNVETKLHVCKIFASSDLLRQLTINLLSNAIKFSDVDGTISIGAQNEGDKVKLVFEDTGIGMDSDTLDHIFTSYYQADKSKSIQGNGLGLPIAKKIVELSGGTITVESEIGKGTRITITLPALP